MTPTQNLTIPAGPPPDKGMDFAHLRMEGLKLIERLGSDFWTNYNVADPGITILEQLCYAITDLSYRLSFDMDDLLAEPAGVTSKQFFSAREILPAAPLTINDFRKIALDVGGVKNAWFQKAEYAPPEIFFSAASNALGFSMANDAVPVVLNGLYRSVAEKDAAAARADRDIVGDLEAILHANRCLCEDFHEIYVLPVEKIGINAVRKYCVECCMPMP